MSSPETRGAARALLPYAAVAFAACAWGAWPLALRHAEALSAAPISSALEATIALGVTSAFGGLLALRDRVRRPAPRRARAWMAWLGASDALNTLLFFAAYKLTVGVAVLSHYLTPIIVAGVSPFLLRERLSARTAFAVGISFAGLAVMLGPTRSGPGAAVILESAALGAGSAVFYASNVIVNKFVADSFSASETMFWHGLVSTPFLAAFVPSGAWAAVDPRALVALAVASIGPGALAGIAFTWGLRGMPAAHASTLTLLEPLVAVMLGVALFGEELGFRAVAGAALILAGAFIVMTSRG